MEDKSSGGDKIDLEKKSCTHNLREELTWNVERVLSPWTPRERGVTIEGWRPQLGRGQIREGPVLFGPAT